jgi:tetratricopeptide (TPR) repeat protein
LKPIFKRKSDKAFVETMQKHEHELMDLDNAGNYEEALKYVDKVLKKLVDCGEDQQVKLYFNFLEKKGRILKRMDRIEEKILMFKEVYESSRFQVTATIHLQRAYLNEGYIKEMEKFCQEFDMKLLDTEALPSQRHEFMLNMEIGMKWKRDNIIRSRPLIGRQKMRQMIDKVQDVTLQGKADMAIKELDKCWTRISSFIKDGIVSETHLNIMTLKPEANQQFGKWKETEGFLRDTLNQQLYL